MCALKLRNSLLFQILFQLGAILFRQENPDIWDPTNETQDLGPAILIVYGTQVGPESRTPEPRVLNVFRI